MTKPDQFTILAEQWAQEQISSKPEPFSIAARILSHQAQILATNGSRLNRLGYSILDRWATNQPDDLRALDKRNPIMPALMALNQQVREQAVLDQPEVRKQLAEGLTAAEVLTMHGVDMSMPTTL